MSADMKAPTGAREAKTCECPGCKQVVGVASDGRLTEHNRWRIVGMRADGFGQYSQTRCVWSGKPAPTEAAP